MANKCSRCKYLDRYYTKELTEFKKTDFGWCSVQKQRVNVREGCENYRGHYRYQKKFLNRALQRRIGDLLTELTELRKVAEEELNARRNSMKDKSAKNKICGNCSMFRRLYWQGFSGYFLTGLFYCGLCKELVPKAGYCENWKKRKTEYDLSARRFDQAEEDACILLQYFESHG